jgi:hypothetical protein
MSGSEQDNEHKQPATLGRKGFLYTIFGGVIAAVAGWIAGIFPREETPTPQPSSETGLSLAESRIAALEAQVSALAAQPTASSGGYEQFAQLEGERNQRIIFNKSELSVINPEGVLLNLVATHGHVGIRFYKDFDFGNEQHTNPWHMGYIEGLEGFEGLAILRDWRFTAALWGEDGKLLLGSLDPYPPGNEPARARLEIRGTLDEVQTLVRASADQTADTFQVAGADGTCHLTVDAAGNIHVGTHDSPKEFVLHDSVDGSQYTLGVTNGSLTLTKVQ